MKRLFYVQMKIICSTKYYMIYAWIVCFFVLANYFDNIIHYWGKDYLQLHDGVKILLLSNYSEYGYYFLQLLPILIILPAGFSLTEDINARIQVFIQSRKSIAQYYWSKMLAVFLSSLMVTIIPLIVEMLLTIIAFPISISADPDNFGMYDFNYVYAVKNLYSLSELYIYNRWIYMLIHILKLGIATGVLNIFTMALSTYIKRYRVLLFLPVYILLNFSGMIGNLASNSDVSYNYFFVFQVFGRVKINIPVFIIFLIALVVISVIIIYRHIKKESLMIG